MQIDMKSFKTQLQTELFGETKTGHCVICKAEVKGFKDALSAKEYRISGMCQSCQDKTFEEEANAPY